MSCTVAVLQMAGTVGSGLLCHGRPIAWHLRNDTGDASSEGAARRHTQG